ncbi:hypothetical protein K488DRAFT_45408, partial [Vararia minispora EC-137]
LINEFNNPHSPYHIPPGTQGPEAPDDPPPPIAAHSRAKLAGMGYDPTSFWEQPIVWGDHDAFQHVNNVRYVRFFESGRMQWISAVANELGGPEVAGKMLNAKGVSFILKSIEVKFRRPVTFPDTLLIAHKPLPWLEQLAEVGTERAGPPLARTQFILDAAAHSYAQDAVVATSSSVVTWYDYDTLRKCDPGDKLWAPVLARMELAQHAARRGGRGSR